MTVSRRPPSHAPPRYLAGEVLGERCELLRASYGTQRFERHFHDGYSIGVVTAGANVFGYRGRPVEVPRGSVCLADPGEVHDGGLGGCAWSYLNMHVSAALMRSLAEDVGLGAWPAFAAGQADDPRCAEGLMRWFAASLDEACDPAAREELAVHALTRLILRHAADAPAERAAADDAVACRALEMLHDVHDRPVALDALAAATGASRFRVIRAVAATTGLPPHAYHLQRRVEQAKRLILAGTPLAQAAAATGFADQAHLTRCMRARAGVTPGLLRVPAGRKR